MIVAVTGLAREARLIAGPNLFPVVSGGDARSLEQRLHVALAKGARRILSIGICGALSPELRVGDAVLASEVIAAQEYFVTNVSWTRELRSRLPAAVVAPLAGMDAISADRASKARLRAETHASAVDMESHVAARAAKEHGLPFAALRVVSDAAHRTLPPAARLALQPSGSIDLAAVLRSVLRAPLQIPALMRTAWEAEIAFAALLRCRNVFDGGFAGADLGELALDMG
jgi:adenosylhomocysteine nucleosidase